MFKKIYFLMKPAEKKATKKRAEAIRPNDEAKTQPLKGVNIIWDYFATPSEK